MLFTKTYGRVLTPGLALFDPILPQEVPRRSPLAVAWRRETQRIGSRLRSRLAWLIHEDRIHLSLRAWSGDLPGRRMSHASLGSIQFRVFDPDRMNPRITGRSCFLAFAGMSRRTAW